MLAFAELFCAEFALSEKPAAHLHKRVERALAARPTQPHAADGAADAGGADGADGGAAREDADAPLAELRHELQLLAAHTALRLGLVAPVRAWVGALSASRRAELPASFRARWRACSPAGGDSAELCTAS